MALSTTRLAVGMRGLVISTGAGGYPAVTDVESGVVFGATGELTGTLALPAETDVESGVQYGAGGTEFTGTLAVSTTISGGGGGFDGLLNTTCNIRRKTNLGQAASGRDKFSWANVATSQPCRLNPGNGKETMVDKQVVIADFVLFLKAGVDVTEKDEIVIGSTTYEVLKKDDAAGHGHHIECDLKEVRV